MAITGNNTARLEGRPQVFGDVRVAEIVSNGLLHLSEPIEHLLVGQAVKRTGQTVKASRKREERGAKGAANKVGGVSADVATLVVGVDGQVETEQLNEVGVVAEAELIGEVEGVILVFLDGRNLAALEDVLVDARSNVGQLGDEVHRILVGVNPVVLLVNAISVGLGEGRGVLESCDCQ